MINLSNIKILTDSGSDLPKAYLDEHNVTLIPLRVHLDDKEYDDQIDIDSKVVFDAMRNGKSPKTSQASPNTIKEIFTKMAKEKQTGIYIAFSSQLSGTYQTAVMIYEQVLEEYPELDITIIDTKCASLGHGLVVHQAVQMAENGSSKEDIIAQVHFYSESMESLFTVDDLEYLRRGGRVSRASAFVGGLLNIKPLLNVEDGKLIPIEKHRGQKKLYNRIVELMAERGVDLQNQMVGISHGDDLEKANLIKDAIQERFGTKEFFISMIGSAIGAHAGPGTIAIFFLNKKPNS